MVQWYRKRAVFERRVEPIRADIEHCELCVFSDEPASLQPGLQRVCPAIGPDGVTDHHSDNLGQWFQCRRLVLPDRGPAKQGHHILVYQSGHEFHLCTALQELVRGTVSLLSELCGVGRGDQFVQRILGDAVPARGEYVVLFLHGRGIQREHGGCDVHVLPERHFHQ